MWEFLSSHPWWGLTYLAIICLTVMLVSIGIGAAIGSRRKASYEEYLARHEKRDDDVVH